MKMTVADYLSQLTNGQAVSKQVEKTATQAQQKTNLTTAIEFVIEQLDTGHLGQYQMTVKMKKGDPVSLRVESNLINIPMAEAERLDGKLLDKEVEYPVNVYLVIESEDVNQSGLRIDELANETDQGGKVAALVAKAQEWVAEYLADIMEARA